VEEAQRRAPRNVGNIQDVLSYIAAALEDLIIYPKSAAQCAQTACHEAQSAGDPYLQVYREGYEAGYREGVRASEEDRLEDSPVFRQIP